MTSGPITDRPTGPDQMDPPKAQTRHYERGPRSDIASMDHFVERVTSHSGTVLLVTAEVRGVVGTAVRAGNR